MVLTRAGAKRNAIEATLDTSTQTMKSELISAGVISAINCPNDRLLCLLYRKHVTCPTKPKRQKCERNNTNVSKANSFDPHAEGTENNPGVISGQTSRQGTGTQHTPPESRPVPVQERYSLSPDGQTSRQVTGTQHTPPEPRPVPIQERYSLSPDVISTPRPPLSTEWAESLPSAGFPFQSNNRIMESFPVDDRDSVHHRSPSPPSPQVPSRTAHEKGKRRQRSVVHPDVNDFELSALETPGTDQRTRRGAHPSTNLPSLRRSTKSQLRSSRFISRVTKEADDEEADVNETNDDDEMDEEYEMDKENELDDEDETEDETVDEESDTPPSRQKIRSFRSKPTHRHQGPSLHRRTEEESTGIAPDPSPVADSDETVDEESDTPPSRQKIRNSRSKPSHRREGPSPHRRTEEESTGIVSDPSPVADSTSLARENARLRQIIMSLQSTMVSDRRETQNLNQNLQTLTGVVERLVDSPAQSQNRPELVRREKPPKAPRGGLLVRVIAGLIKTLLGQKKDVKLLPSPATPAEMRVWRTSMSLEELIAGQIDLNPEPQQVVIPVDPQFPYPGGPGNEQASPVELRIIWRTMQQAAVSSFRPNFRRPVNSPENVLLWRLAAAACVRLIRCGEIRGLTEEESDPKNILSRVKTHAKETLFRKYRQQQNWSVAQLDSQKKRKVRYSRWFHTKQARERYALSRNHLWPLADVIQHCTSDDETDVDATPQARKVVKVRNFRWRNPDLEKLLVAVDVARERRKDTRLPVGAPPTIRERRVGNPYNEGDVPIGLNIDCYCPKFLNGCREDYIFDLKINPQPILDPLMDLYHQGLI